MVAYTSRIIIQAIPARVIAPFGSTDPIRVTEGVLEAGDQGFHTSYINVSFINKWKDLFVSVSFQEPNSICQPMFDIHKFVGISEELGT